MKQTYQVNIGISEDTREQIAIGLGKVLSDRMIVHEKTAWMLRSLL